MDAEKFEKVFLTLSGIMLAIFLVALGYAAIGFGIGLPSRSGELDPSKVDSTSPFDDPGVHQVGPNHYEAVLIGQTWSFLPPRLEVPAGAKITFKATSRDVIHGLHIEGTRVNLMLIPGQVSKITYRFPDPGEHLYICHEYCGQGHHAMFGKVVVTEGKKG